MKKLLLAACLLTALSCPAETKQALTLIMESGASIVYYLDTKPSIEFEGQTMVVNIADEVSKIPMEDVNHWEIGDVEYSGVDTQTVAAEVRITVHGNALHVHSPAADDIIVYNIEGRIVSKSVGPQANFSLSGGVYLITVANKSYKIAIR